MCIFEKKLEVNIKIENILQAERRISNIIIRTPLEKNKNYSNKYSADIYFKREDLQVVRSYKLRGAFNCISSLSPEELAQGVVCASAGNHAQGVAFSCKMLAIKGDIFMPSTTPQQKVNQVKMFGGDAIEIHLVGDNFDVAFQMARKYSDENGKTFVHPFDDIRIIEGQATVGVEIMQELKSLPDYVFVPIGGGGLIAGVASYIKSLSPKTKIIGVEPEGAAGMKASFEKGEVVTLAKMNSFVDGAAVRTVGKLNYEIAKDLVDEIITVPEGKICSTIISLYNEEAIVVEPAGALTITALDYKKEEIKGKTVVAIISGGNNDLNRMQEIRERSLMFEGLKYYFLVKFPQRAGALKEFVDEILGPNDDITRFEYAKKNARETGPALIGIELKFKSDFEGLINRLNKKQIVYTLLNDDPILFEYFV